MKNGDIAGLVLLQALSGFAGIEQDGDQKYIIMYTGDNESAASETAVFQYSMDETGWKTIGTTLNMQWI